MEKPTGNATKEGEVTPTQRAASPTPRTVGPPPTSGTVGPLPTPSTAGPSQDWPLFEVFIRSRSGLEHKHVGSLHAADALMAVDHARDVYTRRQEGVSIWVIRSSDIVASDPADADTLFEPARDKVYRHPTFYEIPDEVKNL